MPIDARHLVENILRMSENVDKKAIIREMIRIAQEGDVVQRLARMLIERGVDARQAYDILKSGPEEISLRVYGIMKNPGAVETRDSARDLVAALKAKLKGSRRG